MHTDILVCEKLLFEQHVAHSHVHMCSTSKGEGGRASNLSAYATTSQRKHACGLGIPPRTQQDPDKSVSPSLPSPSVVFIIVFPRRPKIQSSGFK